MLALSKKTHYALIAVTHLAQLGEDLASARQIAEQFGVPLPLLINILKSLHQHGLVESVRGSQGGYYLAKPPEQITMAALIDAVEGPLALVQCFDQAEEPGGERCELEAHCPVRYSLARLQERIHQVLCDVTILEVVEYEPPVPVTRKTRMKLPIYLDNNATTRLDPRVLEAMMPHLTEKFGNAASRSHRFGWDAEEAVEKAREQVASVLGASPKEIIWTSGATESDNIAIKGVARMYAEKGRHIITCATEHKAVLDTCKYLEQHGYEVTYLPVDTYGCLDLDQLADAICDQTILVSIMHANNEIGTLHPIEQIGRICKERGVLFHTDATQSFGKEPIDVDRFGIDLLSLSGHKIYGPKGVGGLYVRRKNPRVRCEAVIHGGGHERGMRSGTLNVPGIVGLGAAAEICQHEMATEQPRLRALSDRLRKGLEAEVDEITFNGHPRQRLANTLNVSFAYVEGESLMMGMDDIAVSSGSACTSASLEPSYVLKALGVGEDLAHSSIRFSIGRYNTAEEIDYVIDRVASSIRKLREMSPLYEMAKEGVDLSKVQW